MIQSEDFKLASYPPPVESQAARSQRERCEKRLEAAEAVRNRAARRLYDFENGNVRNERYESAGWLRADISSASAYVEKVLRERP